jgi:hypothetical protein
MDIQEITQTVEKKSLVLRQIMAEIEKVVVGQGHLMERMLIGLFIVRWSSAFGRRTRYWLRQPRMGTR